MEAVGMHMFSETLNIFKFTILICYGSHTSILNCINGHHKQYINVGIIFNYMCHFWTSGKYLYHISEHTPFGAGASKVRFNYFYKDMFLEVQK